MIGKILVVFVGIVLCGGLLVPVIQDEALAGEDTLDIVVLGGQSNAAYTLGTPRVDPEVTRENVPLPSTNCYYFGTDSRPVYHSTDLNGCTIHNMIQESQWHIGGEEAAIAYYLSEKTHDDVLVINVAVPGQSIDKFLPGTQYGDRIVEILDLALPMVPSHYSEIRCGFVWIQGEADKTTPIADYIADFDIIQGVFSGFGFDMCYMVQTRPSDSGNATAAQREIVETHPNVIMASYAPATFSVSSGTLVEGNEIHYTQKGRDIVGEDLGTAIAAREASHLRELAGSEIILIIPVIVLLSIIAVVGYGMISRRN